MKETRVWFCGGVEFQIWKGSWSRNWVEWYRSL